MTSFLLQGGLIATFNSENKPQSFVADILINGPDIVKIEQNIPAGPDVQVIDCSGKWVTPGFIDTHRHVWMSILKGLQDDWLLSEYLVKNSWHIQTDVTSAELRIGQLSGFLEALNSGVTTILDHFHAANTPEHAEAALEATIESRARVVFAPSRQSPPTQVLPHMAFGHEPGATQWQTKKLQEWAAKDGGKLTRDGRVLLGLAYDSVGFDFLPITVHQDFIKFARSLPVHIITAHVVKGPTILKWKDAGILGPDVVFSHCNELWGHTDPGDKMWAAMKESGAGVASTPEDELGMAHGNPVAFKAVERGVKCGLGADCLSINGGDIFTQMRFALQFDRGRRHEEVEKVGSAPPLHNKFKSADAFRLATLGGAETLNLSHLIGTIEVGKKADIVIFNASESVNLSAIEDPLIGVTFHATDADVETVFVNGEIVKRNGKLLPTRANQEWKDVAKLLREKSRELRSRWPENLLEEKWQEYYNAKGGHLFRK
ncbi:Metallo-dependent hydrolase [Panus rudis PR-1116 ss-1]|nr:Metallo-dependent hydrolase [Panus rudis PR-1116 ss-1]